VVIQASGELRLTRCLVSGGAGKDDKYIGAGIVVYENARAVISECLIVDNEAGVIVRPKAEARVEFCKFIANAGSGLIVRGTCEVRHSEFLRNLKDGIYADGEGRLIARSNTCEENQWSGISLSDSAQGEVVGNTCRNNGLHGIGAQDQSRLVARNNTCEGNKRIGIALFGSAQGEVSGNACRNNGTDGITASQQSRLVARNNTCERNQDTGIALFGSAQGEVEGNRCVNNRNYGIYVHERSVKAVLRNNTVYGNLQDIYDPRR
jgi:parallel beta-helix repeat protein